MNVYDYFFEESKYLNKDFILGENSKISFHDLHINSYNLACYIQDNFGINNKILIISPNSSFFILVYLGILKSGNICIPIDPNIENENLDYIINETDPHLIFTPQKRSKIFSNIDESIVVIDQSDLMNIDLTGKMHETNNDLEFDENRIAEILFTSGSTGKPKGVMISHLNIISNTNSIIKYLSLTKSDIACVVLPFYYCYGLSLLHSHLKKGGALVLNNTFIFYSTVINDLKKYGCTGFAGVPSHFQILLKKSMSFKNTKFPDLRYVTQAGGKLHDVFIKDFSESFPSIDFYVMYGQTEATARLSYLAPEQTQRKLGSIGKAIPDVKLIIADAKGNELPYGEIGEILAKGKNIMLGYYNDKILTNLTIKNGWLHTGDIAKMDQEGFIYIVAREKEFLKVRGKRISPKEIEEVLISFPEVIDCSVVGYNDDLTGEAIKAIVFVEGKFLENELMSGMLEKCRKKLAPYKIPQKIEFSQTMKLKATGKKHFK